MAEPPPLPLKKPPGYRDPSAPVYPPPNPPIRRQRKKRRNICRICCCCCCIFFFILLFIAAIAVAIFYLWFNPKLPIFHLQSIRIDPFNVTNEADGTYLSATTTARIEARNPNHLLHIRYADTTVSINVANIGDGTYLGTGKVAGFVQGRKNSTSLKFVSNVKHVVIGDSTGTQLKAKWKSKELALSIEAKTGVGFGTGGWMIRTVGVKVLCENVTLKKLDDDTLPKCTINVFKWINIH